MNIEKRKIGLALGSGAVRGLAHIGVIKVLEENNINIDYIAGSSIGALIGAHYAIYKDSSKLEKIALANNWKTASVLFDPSITGGLIKGTKIEQMLNAWYEGAEFNDVKIPLSVVATDLKSGNEVNINEGSITRAVRSSISIPSIFKPIIFKDFLLSDAGLSNPVPVSVARKMGADIVIAVNLDNNYYNNSLNKKSVSIPRTTLRALNIIRYHFTQHCINESDIVVEPKIMEAGFDGWNKFFDKKGIKELITQGEEATREAMPAIKRLLK